jgi:sugar lactone lactonase YvrE
MNVNCIWEGKTILGESPLWDSDNQTLYWVDMEDPVLHCLNLNTDSYSKKNVPAPLNSITVCKNGDLLATMQQSIIIIKQPDFQIEVIYSLTNVDENIIFNDGQCDNSGRFWVGTRDKCLTRPICKLYSYTFSTGLIPVVDQLIASNGLGWNPSCDEMYITDTMQKTIFRYRFDRAKGTVQYGYPFINVADENVYPDGLTVDSMGGIWSAMWGAGNITRFHSTGEIDTIIELPVKNVTSCCFGGNELKTLFVTSASIDFGDAKEQLLEQC